MISQHVTIIDQERKVVATAQITEQEGYFVGRIDLSPMSAILQQQKEAVHRTGRA
jgi:hypothetical protein